MTNVALSVLLIVRNSVGTIERAIQSVLSQDYPHFELLVLDGGSSDGTAELLVRYKDRCVYWRSAPDGSAINAINEGVYKAKGDVIALLSGDDWFEPGAFGAIAGAFAANRGLEVLSCGTQIVTLSDKGEIASILQHTDPRSLVLSIAKVTHLPLTHARFVRRDVYQRVGPYDVRYPVSVDLDFLLRLCLMHPVAEVLPVIVYTYRRHAGSNTLGSVSGRLQMLRDDLILTRKYLDLRGLTASDRRALFDLHSRASLHLAWLLWRDSKTLEAMKTLIRAVAYYPGMPLRFPVWLLARATRRRPRML